MSEPIKDYEGFLAWLKRGAERSPRLYGNSFQSPAKFENPNPPTEKPPQPKLLETFKETLLPIDQKSLAAGEDAEEVEDEGIGS